METLIVTHVRRFIGGKEIARAIATLFIYPKSSPYWKENNIISNNIGK
jgi:hypothetical protein